MSEFPQQDPVPTSGPTPAAKWKANKDGPVTMPSGNVAKLKRPGMQSFVTRGMIPNMLMGPVTKAMSQGGEPDMDELKQLAQDPQMLVEFFTLLDDICVEIFVEPPLSHIPGPNEQRDENVLYVDEIDMDDKMFAFEYAVGGARSVEQFRQQQNEMLAAVSPGEGVEPPAQ